jgi:hypothetical protein
VQNSSLGKPLTEKQKREILAALEAGDENIDCSDIPEIREIPPDAVRGKFYSPGAAAVTRCKRRTALA